MCVSADLMDQGSLLRLKLLLLLLIAFLLMSTNAGNSTRTGVGHGLRCVNDYLRTITCSLNITPSDHSSDWLFLMKPLLDRFDDDETYACMLSNTTQNRWCTFQTSETFEDTDRFEISLCPNMSVWSESCEVLDDEYTPKHNITPTTPCCLTVTWNSNPYFTWESSYEKYLPNFFLIPDLRYQLQYYERGHKERMKPLYTDKMNLSVDGSRFEPDTEYSIRVRSRPNQVTYFGEWSGWSTEAHWKTEPVVKDPPRNPLLYLNKRLIILVCVLVPLLLLLCYASAKKWKQSAFIPTPEPYFQSLYSDCQGDFKIWVVTPNNKPDLLQAEEIDTMTRCADVQELDPQLSKEGPRGVTSDAPLLSISHVETPAPQSSAKSLSGDPESPRGDSGCWLCSATSLERDTPWYNNEYCTLSDTFHKFGSVRTEECSSGSSISNVMSNRDYQNECQQGSVV